MKAITNVIGAAFGSAGERCMAASVITRWKSSFYGTLHANGKAVTARYNTTEYK